MNKQLQEMRELTIDTLQKAVIGNDEFIKIFESCSDAFEEGEDSKAMGIISETIPHLTEFSVFCTQILVNCRTMITDDQFSMMNQLGNTLANHITELVNESENGNYIGMADILRIDLSELFNKYSELFPQIATTLQEEVNP